MIQYPTVGLSVLTVVGFEVRLKVRVAGSALSVAVLAVAMVRWLDRALAPVQAQQEWSVQALDRVLATECLHAVALLVWVPVVEMEVHLLVPARRADIPPGLLQ